MVQSKYKMKDYKEAIETILKFDSEKVYSLLK